MKIILASLLLVFVISCSTLPSQHSFNDGKYWLTITWNDRRPYCQLVYIENNDGVLDFISTLNGDRGFSGFLKEDKFFAVANYVPDGRHCVFHGRITTDNHIAGTIRGRIIKDITRAYPANSKVETIGATGPFDIRPATGPTPRETLSFLPLADYGRTIRKFDPRSVFIMIDKNGKLYTPNLVHMGDSSIQLLEDKKAVTIEQFGEKITKNANKFGNDFPLLVYANKEATIQSLAKFFQICQKKGLYWIRFCALQPKWDGIYIFPVDLVDQKALSQVTIQVLDIQLNNGQWALMGKTYPKQGFKKKLFAVGENDPEQPILLKWSNTGTVQDLVSVLSILQESGLTNINLYPQSNR